MTDHWTASRRTDCLEVSAEPLHIAARQGLSLLSSYEGSISIAKGLSRAAWAARKSARDIWPALAAAPPRDSWLWDYHTSSLLDAIANAEYYGRTQAAILAELDTYAVFYRAEKGGAA